MTGLGGGAVSMATARNRSAYHLKPLAAASLSISARRARLEAVRRAPVLRVVGRVTVIQGVVAPATVVSVTP
jgi:hypothetical protein